MNSSTTSDQTQGRSDAHVRAGSPDPANPTPERSEGVPPRIPPPPTSTPNAERGPAAQSHTLQPERRDGVPPPSPAPSTPNAERGSRRQSRNRPQNRFWQIPFSQNAVTHGLRAKKIDNAVAPNSAPPTRRSANNTSTTTNRLEPSRAPSSTWSFSRLAALQIRDMELFTDLDLGMPGSFGRSEKLARYRGSHERLFFEASINSSRYSRNGPSARPTRKPPSPPISRPPSASNPSSLT